MVERPERDRVRGFSNFGRVSGGGVYVERDSSVLERLTLTRNRAEQGGAFFSSSSSTTLRGNVLTGKGNIVESRRNSKQITPNIIEQVLASPKIPPDGISEIMRLIQARWDAVGYGGRYADWITKKRPAT